MGATYKRDDSLLIDFTNLIKDEDMLLLVPGIGAQGGNIDDFLSSMIYYNINVKNCMLNVGRQLMYPENNSKNPYREEAEKLNKLIQKYL
ncbi:MAG: hypothetical protein QM532_02345 [Cyanobium sp. MAG06]|nr:hypothetical protein [Cyanobium sp. MAG06]